VVPVPYRDTIRFRNHTVALSKAAAFVAVWEFQNRTIVNFKSQNPEISNWTKSNLPRVVHKCNLKFRDFGFEIPLRPISKFPLRLGGFATRFLVAQPPLPYLVTPAGAPGYA
jgi:hypothetical protein